MKSTADQLRGEERVRPEDIRKILQKHDGTRGALISILEGIQEKYGYLPAETLRIVAKETGRPLVDLYGVATFYKSFSLRPKGKHLISVCSGTACHVRGSKSIIEEFERQLKIRAGENSDDMEFTFETVNCLGACALGPIVVLDGQYIPNVSTAKVRSLLKKARLGRVETGGFRGDQSIFPIRVSCPRCNHSLMDSTHPIDGCPSIRMVVSVEQKHGLVRLSSLYGSYHVESEHAVPEDTVAHFFCPHCQGELKGTRNCIECGAPMIPMVVRGGGIEEICSRRGCTSHMLDLGGAVY